MQAIAFFRMLFLSFLGFNISLVFAENNTNLSEENNENRLIVTAELKDINVLDLPTSVSVIDDLRIQQLNAQHFSDLLNLAPNVNFATGASRGRFVQIRGVGERSEFSEPVNYSVGIVLDGIDLTGIAGGATLLDIQQVEVLRGPQGTLYGANGLAGLINLVSHSPTETFFANVSASFETFAGASLSTVVSGAVSDQLGYRIAAKKYRSDGYMKNVYLNRNDTNNLNENSLRGKLVYQSHDHFTFTSNLFLTDINNGYDAFSLDANRNTYSDQPGHDRQKTKAVSFNADWRLSDVLRLETIVSAADSDLEYGYDEDWSHLGICDNTECDSDLWGFDWWYSSFDDYLRSNKNNSVDIRLHGDDETSNWVIGFYYRDQQVDLTRRYTFFDNQFSSQFETDNRAIYGQVSFPVSKTLTLTSGLRFESRDANYTDSEQVAFKPKENLWGGKAALEYRYAKDKLFYTLISRGYKNGGFNTDGSIASENREYDTEFMWNYETGIKGHWLDHSLTLQIAVFYQDRENVQTKQSIVRSLADGITIQQGGECPCSFTDYTDNATQTDSYGLEIEASLSVSDRWHFYSTLGLLKNQFKDFKSYTHVSADVTTIPPVPYDLSARASAHSPEYQVVLGAHYFLSEQWTINPEIEAKDDFYFSDRHEEKSNSYEVINLRLTYQQDNWQVNLFAHNLTDETIQTRGFGSFGNDPRKFYTTEPYYQFAAPRVIGLSASIDFE